MATYEAGELTMKADEQDMTHRCPAPGCKVHVGFEQVGCPEHWALVPARWRDWLARLWREDFGSDDYFRVRGRCLHFMGVPTEDVGDLNAGTAPL